MDLKIGQSQESSDASELAQCENALTYKQKYASLMLDLAE